MHECKSSSGLDLRLPCSSPNQIQDRLDSLVTPATDSRPVFLPQPKLAFIQNAPGCVLLVFGYTLLFFVRRRTVLANSFQLIFECGEGYPTSACMSRSLPQLRFVKKGDPRVWYCIMDRLQLFMQFFGKNLCVLLKRGHFGAEIPPRRYNHLILV